VVTRNALSRILVAGLAIGAVLAFAGCSGDAVSQFTGGTNSKDKTEIPPAVSASATEQPQPQVPSAPDPARVEGPAVATKGAQPLNEETTKTGVPLREQAMLYRASKSRDPFRSLVSSEDENWSDVVDLSVVTLVGVVTSGEVPFCVVEDVEGISYVLRKDDRVKNGRVVRITEDALVASQTILGYTTTVQLKLEERKDVKNG
jgi:hypothetical protein